MWTRHYTDRRAITHWCDTYYTPSMLEKRSIIHLCSIYCVPDTHQVAQVAFSLKLCLILT